MPRHSTLIKKLIYCTITVLAISLTLSSTTFAETNQNLELLRKRIHSFQTFEAEELATYSQIELLLMLTQKKYAESLQHFQYILISERASTSSPIDRKQVKNDLYQLREKIKTTLSKLQEAQEECVSRIDVINSFDNISIPSETPDSLKIIYRNNINSISQLRFKSKKQLSKIGSLLTEGNRVLKRLDKLEQGEKHNLLQLWSSYLLVGKNPVFSPVFWSTSFQNNNWWTIKSSEFQSALDSYDEKALRHLSLFAILILAGLALKSFVERQVNWHEVLGDNQFKIKSLFIASLFGFALYVATRITFPSTMESLEILAFGLFFISVLKISKYICTDNFILTSGRSRTAVLFTLSSFLLALHVPSKWVTLFFLGFLVSSWFLNSASAWKKRRFQGLLDSTKKSSFLSPLLVISFFGFGRLACFLAILWSLGIFIRSFGMLWGQILFLSTEKNVKLFKGLVRSLAVPLGWAIAFSIAYFWLVGFFGQSTVLDVLAMNTGWDGYSISIGNIVSVFVLFFMTKHSVSAFKVSIELVGRKWPRGKRGAVPSMQTLFSYGIWTLFALLAMRILGLNLTSIAVIAGGLSVGIGFGLQNIVNNFISGLILLFGRSIQQGDVIELNSLWCTVKNINIRTTLVETFENAVIMIPNSDLVTNQVTNWTKNNSILRRDILVGVAYGSDTDRVRRTLLEVANENPHVLSKPEPYVHFNDFGSSSLDFILRVWIDDIDNTIKTISELRFAIDRYFRRDSIEIAFPQVDLHLKSSQALADVLGKNKDAGGNLS
ncbi:mechanosensitive ion channel family protein [Maridesulfovibrio ferrireducens]|uniref:mechanosensitive ion channel family protein n=1 Tax=Maridesulfovibrio ferrireducens TaxID=246191 RepID=UPI001A35C0B0|nr:mechanosensitive ion channel domain-containing protein [Maridesulfovibrio ferrireducens]MBI9112170.1 mechanosensitive ion channel [Maridesulfovibrio ferrireducens]